MQKSLFGLKQNAFLLIYLIAVQDLAKKIIIFKSQNVRTERDLILVHFFHFTDTEIKD